MSNFAIIFMKIINKVMLETIYKYICVRCEIYQWMFVARNLLGEGEGGGRGGGYSLLPVPPPPPPPLQLHPNYQEPGAL